ncbi:MAG: glycosyltransferase [Cytophagales bacterium]|nr:glycosyltransferase [Cytophagales bacterium]MDW8383322.1 glycosyltransferase [Flammeovirgaceae bacterium]
MKILYVSYDGMTDSLGLSQVIAYLTKIADSTTQIDIISFEKPEVYSTMKEIVQKAIASKNIRWMPLSYTKKPPIFSTLKDLRNGLKTALQLHARHRYDIVHCRGYLPALIGRELQRKGAKFIFDMRGWWADEKKESGAWNSWFYYPIYQFFKQKEKEFFKKADKVISLTHAGKNYIVAKGWQESNKIGVIPTCVDFDIFPPFSEETRQITRKRLNIPPQASVLVYSGSIGGNYKIEDFLTTIKVWIQTQPNSYFLMLSKYAPSSDFQEKLATYQIPQERVIITSVPFPEVYAYLQASDIGLILYELTFSVIGRSPTKLGEYWASGIPVISLRGIGDLDAIIAKYPQGGYLMENITENSLKVAFERFEKLPDKTSLRNYALEYFHINKGVEFYKNIYAELLKI